MLSFARISVILLWLVGVIAQTLGSGLAGSVLCFGCERTGWTIVAPATHAVPNDCCADECEPSEVPHNHGVRAEKSCGCLTVALGQGLQHFVASPRLKASHGEVVTVCITPGIAPITVPVYQSEIWARAGPPHPPRLLSPSSRRTVLVI
jgi:hypothetical protein